jgi:Rad3-related DNA helicase
VFTVNLARIVPDGLLVFFPSYYLLEQSIACWKSLVSPNEKLNLFALGSFNIALWFVVFRVMKVQHRYGKEFANTKNQL